MMNVIDEETIDRVKLYVSKNLSEKRYRHSVSVAETAQKLANYYSEDENLAYFAGFCHDMCKEMDTDALVNVAVENNYNLSCSEIAKPSLLHGCICGFLLQKDFDIHNEILLEAVTHHTFGKSNMHAVSKIVCIADKIEPTRSYMTSEKFDNYLKFELDELLFVVLSEIIEHRRSGNEEVFPEALWIYHL